MVDAHLALGAVAAGDWAVGVATVVAAVIAVVGSVGGLRRWYRRTLGRRRHAYERLGRLGTGAQLSFFESVLGEPAAVRHTVVNEQYREIVSAGDPRFDLEAAIAAYPEDPTSHDVYEQRAFLRSIFVDRDFLVQTISDDDDTVSAFSVTTRSRRFAPTFQWPPSVGWLERRRIAKLSGEKYRPHFRVRLGRTRFSDFGDEESDDFAGPRFRISVGAHNYAYSEFTSLGRPGAYQTFVFTASDVAPGPFGDGVTLRADVAGGEWPGDDRRTWNAMSEARRFRRETVVTTYTAIGMALWEENFPTTFAPDVTTVWTLP